MTIAINYFWSVCIPRRIKLITDETRSNLTAERQTRASCFGVGLIWIGRIWAVVTVVSHFITVPISLIWIGRIWAVVTDISHAITVPISLIWIEDVWAVVTDVSPTIEVKITLFVGMQSSIDVYPAEEQSQIRAMLSETLRAVITQRLIPGRQKQGMELAAEILIGTLPMINLIKDGKTFQIPSMMQTAKAAGMQSMDDAIMGLLKTKKISAQAAAGYANDPKKFRTYLEKETP